jgi:Zn-dependent peptidase ImmA (M78 family)
MINSILLVLISLFAFAFDRQPYKKLIKQWSSMFRMKTKYHSRYSDIFEVDVVDNVMYISRFNKAIHSEVEYLYSVAHEFGHLIDHAYRDYYDQESKLSENKAVYNDEARAWRIARGLLQQTEHYDEKAFNKLRARCLQEYKIALKLDKRPHD